MGWLQFCSHCRRVCKLAWPPAIPSSRYPARMVRHTYIVAWDIACPQRLARVGQAAKAWRAAGQRSVAECRMSAAERRALAGELSSLIDHSSDRLHLFRLDPRLGCHLFGIARSQGNRPFTIT